MKRLLLWLVVTVFAALTGGPAFAALDDGTALRPVAAAELDSVTGGRCFVKCDEEDDDGGGGGEEEDEPEVIDVVWRKVSQTDSAAEQLAYSIYTEVSNVYGLDTQDYRVVANDQCRYRWVSGGFGISKGLSVQIGRTYQCDALVEVEGRLKPGYRVKIYQGDMRQYSTVTMAEYEVYSDGSSHETGSRDVGRREKRWNRYSPVVTYGY